MYTAREGKKKGVWDLWPQAAPPLGDWSSLSLSPRYILDFEAPNDMISPEGFLDRV